MMLKGFTFFFSFHREGEAGGSRAGDLARAFAARALSLSFSPPIRRSPPLEGKGGACFHLWPPCVETRACAQPIALLLFCVLVFFFFFLLLPFFPLGVFRGNNSYFFSFRNAAVPPHSFVWGGFWFGPSCSTPQQPHLSLAQQHLFQLEKKHVFIFRVSCLALAASGRGGKQKERVRDPPFSLASLRLFAPQITK